MQLLPNKILLLIWSILFSGLAGIWVWRMRSELVKTTGARSPWLAPLVGGGALMLLVGWWNGTAVYMADESMYLLAANSYAAGMWTIEAPPIGSGEGQLRVSEFEALFMAKSGDRMYPKYPLGWPVILAGLSAVVPVQLAGPLLGIGILILAGYYARRFLPDGTAEETIWVMALSASFLLTCVGFASHAATGFLMILAAIFLEHGMETGQGRYMALTMLICAAMAAVRPLSGGLGMATAGLVFFFRFGFWRTAAAGWICSSKDSF